MGDNTVFQFQETSICEIMEKVCNVQTVQTQVTVFAILHIAYKYAILSSVTQLLCYLHVVVDPEQKNVAFPSQEDVNNSNPKIATKARHFLG